jgi:pilus assembly protein CpaF
VIDKIDLGKLSSNGDDLADKELELAIRAVLEEEHVSVTREERNRLVTEIRDEVMGLGPLEPLLADEIHHRGDVQQLQQCIC